MASVKPFRGTRYTEKAGELFKLICPPYDIIDAKKRAELSELSPYNLVNLELPVGADPYSAALDTMISWSADGIIAEEAQPAFYIYRMDFGLGGYTASVDGVIASVRLEEFGEDSDILPHEYTLSGAKEDRFKLLSATECNISPVYSIFRDPDGAVRSMIDTAEENKPTAFACDNDGVYHSLWVVDDPDFCKKLSDLFRPKRLYIADGHHRYETALNYMKHHPMQLGAERVMMALVPLEHEGLTVFPTHRVVHGIENYNRDAMIFDSRSAFSVTLFSADEAVDALSASARAGECSFLCYDGDYSLFTLKDDYQLRRRLPFKSDAYRSLDLVALHTLVLEDFFGIDEENMRLQKNLSYTRDAAEAVSLVNAGEANCCFILGPPRVSDILAVADEGERMPQKSTYFYPKLTTGLVMRRLGS